LIENEMSSPSAKRTGSVSTPLSNLSVTDWVNGTHGSNAAQRLVEDVSSAIAESQGLNVFITETVDRAMAQAERSDERIRSGRGRPLEGLVLAIKDNFCTFGTETTAGSRILRGFVPRYESFVTQKLLDAGAVFIGKTNMDQFGMGSSTENSAFGPTLNPRGVALGSKDYVPGGSSGGSAAAVAANLSLAAMATDTGGSIRQPASFCGVVGFKPTYGACSRWGIIAYGSSLDQAGVITKTVLDAAILMDVIAGEDANDSTSIAYDFGGFEKQVSQEVSSFTVGIPRQLRSLALGPDLEGVWAELEARVKRAGGVTKLIDLPTISYALPTYYIIALAEASSNLARYDGVRYGFRASDIKDITELYEKTRSEGFSAETQKRIIMGTYCLSSGYYDQYYSRAQKIRAKIYAEFVGAFENVDLLAWPTAPTPAFKFGSHETDPLSMYLEDVFTVPINLGGFPAISLPIYEASNRMPMGAQLIGPRFQDVRVLAVANLLL
jgi:aspartyl-tRNA(Asn)/glutamyl-tRNA(Gln) amidotransferase subunit A